MKSFKRSMNYLKNSAQSLCFFFILSILLPVDAFSQTSDVDERRLSVIHIPGVPSPTAASLGQYANHVVSSFTGTPSINIPIYEANVDGFKLPVSMSYNSSGVKVSDVASWVGLGWSLNCGGVITRNVMDIPDDADFMYQGWLKYNYLVPPNSWVGGHRTLGYSPTGGGDNAVGLGEMRQSGTVIDTEPDIFYFNFNGHVGKFVFSQGSDTTNHTGQVAATAHSINLIPYQDLKVSYTLSVDSRFPTSESRLPITAFKIIDEEGNTYFFEQSEHIATIGRGSDFIPPTIISAGGYTPYYNVGRDYQSAWYLSKILTAKNKKINFNYVAENYTQVLPETYSVRNFQSNIPYVAYVDCNQKYDFYNVSYNRSRNQVNWGV